MHAYRPPLGDIDFALAHHARLGELVDRGGFGPDEREAIAGLVAEAGRFISEVVAPLNRPGDEQGCHLEDGRVVTPDGFPDAYRRFVVAGWGALDIDAKYGGGGLPTAVGIAVEEMLTAANLAFSLCPMLTRGAVELLSRHGGPEHRPFLDRLATGEWTATMCLTEADAGSDLGGMRARATPAADGTWRVRGTKVFITYGEHDLAPNIVHLVLARAPDAPAGTRGISCFLVPRYLPDHYGEPTIPNDVHCGGIERKLGIHASPTCTLTFGGGRGAVGYLVGDVHQGLAAMFTMMNRSRLSIGVEALGLAERAYQQAAAYATERRQGKAVGTDVPSSEASLIAEHPDVRRMLLSMKAYIDAIRGLIYEAAGWIDRSEREDAIGEQATDRVHLLTPVVKAWCSNRAVDVASLGIQVHGGAGYIEDVGAAQYLRDARITPIYEGTNGIQADDLVRRKLGRKEGTPIVDVLADVARVADTACGTDDPVLGRIGQRLREAVTEAYRATTHLLSAKPRAQAAAASDYLELLGLLLGGGAVTRAALVTADEGDHVGDNPAVLSFGRPQVADFYTAHLLGQTRGLSRSVITGDEALFGVRPRRRLRNRAATS